MSFILAFLLTLAWDSNPEPDVSGYRIYWRTFDPSRLELGGPYLLSWDVGNTNRVQFPTVENVYYDFVATCYNASGIESDFSNEIFVIFVRVDGANLKPQTQ